MLSSLLCVPRSVRLRAWGSKTTREPSISSYTSRLRPRLTAYFYAILNFIDFIINLLFSINSCTKLAKSQSNKLNYFVKHYGKNSLQPKLMPANVFIIIITFPLVSTVLCFCIIFSSLTYFLSSLCLVKNKCISKHIFAFSKT